MISHCDSILNSNKYPFLLLFIKMIIFVPFIYQQFSLIVTTILLAYLDYFVSFGSKPPTIIIQPTIIQLDTISSKVNKKPTLLIDTKAAIQETKHVLPITRRRHYSVSSHTDIDFFTNTPTLSPSLSSVSSFSSNWSEERRLSKVEEMIHLFETGGHRPERRYSVDSHNYNPKQFIRERKFEFKPTANEWKKRANSIQNSPIQLSASISTPTRSLVGDWKKRTNSPIQLTISSSTPVRKMPPILEKK